MKFRRLIPEPGNVDVGELVAGLDLASRAPADRPYVIVNFVSSADGRASFRGRSGKLGDEGDRAVFHALRQQADAVLVGTGTLRAERYGRLVRDPGDRRRRQQRGRRPEPLACVVTRSGSLPIDIPLFAEPEAEIVAFSPIEIDTGSCKANVQVVRLAAGQPTFITVLRDLYDHHDVRAVLCEGGPTVVGALLGESVVDELFLTLAPKLTGGGDGPAITSGPELSEPATLTVEWALERAGALYLRYVINA